MAVATTTTSIAVAILEGITRDHEVFLPNILQRWLSKNASNYSKDRSRFWRKVLDRLILSLADQQLITGIALVTSGYIQTSSVPMPPELLATRKGILFILTAHSSLLIYLTCLSSSSHLASVITLRKYFHDHKIVSIIRVCLIVAFALFISITVALANSFSVICELIVRSSSGEAFSIVIPVMIILYSFWTYHPACAIR